MSKVYTQKERELRESQIQDIIRGEIMIAVNDYRRRMMNVQVELIAEFDQYRADNDRLRTIDDAYKAEIRDRVGLHEAKVSQDISSETYKREVAKIARASE